MNWCCCRGNSEVNQSLKEKQSHRICSSRSAVVEMECILYCTIMEMGKTFKYMLVMLMSAYLHLRRKYYLQQGVDSWGEKEQELAY